MATATAMAMAMAMEMETIKICGGVTLHYARDRQFKSGIMTVRYLAPLDVDTASAVTLLFRVLARGTRRHPTSADIRKECEMLWGATLYPMSAALGEIQNIGFTATFINDRLLPLPCGESAFDGICKLMGEMIYDPLTENDGSLLSSFVESERDNLIRELKNEDDKEELCRFKMEGQMFKDEPFSICSDGDTYHASLITPEFLTDFYHDFIMSAPIEVCILADIDRGRAIDRVRELFARTRQRRQDRNFPIATLQRHSPRPPQVIRETRSLAQSRICAGYRSGTVLGDPEFESFALMCEMLGRSPTNRLFTELREKRGLCYSCFLSTELYKGLVRIECSPERSKTQKAYETICETVNSLARGEFSLEELESAKKSLTSAYRAVGDDPLSTASWHYRRYLAGICEDTNEAISAVSAITADQVAASAALLDPDTCYILEAER